MVSTAMKISKRTLDIFKNFSSINSNIYVTKGNVISTISPIKNILAEAEVEETFEVPFGIWDLPKFLGVVSLFSNPEFEFFDKYVTISDENRSVKYYYCDPKLLTVSNKKVQIPNVDVSFVLEQEHLNELRKASSILGVSDLQLSNDEDNNLILQVHDKTDTNSSNSFRIDLGEMKDAENFSGSFHLNFLVENLKLFTGNYDVDISSNIVSRFSNRNTDLTYWIALEMDSSFSE
jgi:hypothetical protein